MSFFLLEIHSGFPKRAKLSLSIDLSFSYLKQQMRVAHTATLIIQPLQPIQR